MGAVAPIASIGLGMVSQMGAASAQQKQVNSQAKAMEQQNMISMDRLALDTKQLEAQRVASDMLSQRETMLNQAQVDQARVAQSEIEQRQLLSTTATTSQIDQQESQSKNSVNAFLGDNASQQNQVNMANAGQLEQLATALEQSTGISKDVISKVLGLTGSKATNLSSNAAIKQGMALGGIEQFQRGIDNSNAASRTTQYMNESAQAGADYQTEAQQLTSELNRSNLAFQQQADALGNSLAGSNITYTGLRNDAGIQAQKYAAQGASSLAQTNSLFDQQNRNVAYQAQLSSLNSQKPGLLSMANTLGQGFNALNQLGIFGGGKPSAQNAPPPGYSIKSNVTIPTYQASQQPSVNYYGGNAQTYDSNATGFSNGGYS